MTEEELKAHFLERLKADLVLTGCTFENERQREDLCELLAVLGARIVTTGEVPQD